MSLLYAHDQTNKEWLPFMPANRFEQGLKYEAKRLKNLKNPYIGLNIIAVSQQNRVPYNMKSDGSLVIRDYSASPQGYVRVDMNAGLDALIGKKVTRFGIRVTNLFDVQYRDYTDRLRYFADALGRNVSMNMKVIF